jgi:hypothetical protein
MTTVLAPPAPPIIEDTRPYPRWNYARGPRVMQQTLREAFPNHVSQVVGPTNLDLTARSNAKIEFRCPTCSGVTVSQVRNRTRAWSTGGTGHYNCGRARGTLEDDYSKYVRWLVNEEDRLVTSGSRQKIEFLCSKCGTPSKDIVKNRVKMWDKRKTYCGLCATNPGWHIKVLELAKRERRVRSARRTSRRTGVARDSRVIRVSRQILRHWIECVYCGREGSFEKDPDNRTWHMDHVVPLSKGGLDNPCNIVKACASCNTSKHARLWKTLQQTPRAAPNATEGMRLLQET